MIDSAEIKQVLSFYDIDAQGLERKRKEMETMVVGFVNESVVPQILRVGEFPQHYGIDISRTEVVTCDARGSVPRQFQIHLKATYEGRRIFLGDGVEIEPAQKAANPLLQRLSREYGLPEMFLVNERTTR